MSKNDFVDLVKKLNEDFKYEEYKKMKECLFDEEDEENLFDDENEGEEDVEGDEGLVGDESSVPMSNDELTDEPTDTDTEETDEEYEDEDEGDVDEETEEDEFQEAEEQPEENKNSYEPLYLILKLLANSDDPDDKAALDLINHFIETRVRKVEAEKIAAERAKQMDDNAQSPTKLFNAMRDYVAQIKKNKKDQETVSTTDKTQSNQSTPKQ